MDFSGLREHYLKQTMQNVRSSFHRDELLPECVSVLAELDVVINDLGTRLRHWAENFFPELCNDVSSNEDLAKQLMTDSKKLRQSDSMGAEIGDRDFAALQVFADVVLCACRKRIELEEYLHSLTTALCPSMSALLGSMLAAKLVAVAGSLKKLAVLPASTIQVLGASEAMLKHLMTKAKPPKHGLIFSHSLVNKAPRAERGRRARALACQIAVAARVDFFGGRPVGMQLLNKLEARFR